MCENLSPRLRCHLGIKAFFSPHSMSLLHQHVDHIGVFCLCVDEKLHTHDVMQDGVQRHNDWVALHQCNETVTGSAAPLVPHDDGLGWRTHFCDLELPSLRKWAEGFCVTVVHSLNSLTDKCASILWPVASLIAVLPGMGETGGQRGALGGCCWQQLLCYQSLRRTPAGQQHMLSSGSWNNISDCYNILQLRMISCLLFYTEVSFQSLFFNANCSQNKQWCI